MKKKLAIWIGSMSILAALLVPARVPSLSQETPAQERKEEKAEGHEAHPHIQAAMRALENAKRQLQEAAHDFGGHRANALQHVDQALQECRLALKADVK
jgi:hypothetical protein